MKRIIIFNLIGSKTRKAFHKQSNSFKLMQNHHEMKYCHKGIRQNISKIYYNSSLNIKISNFPSYLNKYKNEI
jgi:hypothetical protein